jgi:hypothetical protein
MRIAYRKWLVRAAAAAFVAAATAKTEAAAPSSKNSSNPVGIVSNIKVLSDKAPDVSSLEAWKASFIKPGMSDKEKALAVFRSEVTFQQADAPPQEYLQREDAVLDPIKLFNVYGYTLCSVSSANVVCLARYVGLPARCFAINNHVVPEIFYDHAWHMLDADLIEYYPKADGSIASLQEIVDGVSKWKAEHPEYATINKSSRYAFMANPGWKTGPEILRRNPFYDANGWLPCAEFAWGDTMLQFGRIDNGWQSCYSMGYRVNVQLREGESLTRNWFNKGLHVNRDGGQSPGSLTAKIGEGSFRHSPKWGDIAPGRVGNGTLEYDVPLASGAFRGGALTADNLAAAAEEPGGPALHVKDSNGPGVLDIRMPSSYVYLSGRLTFSPVVGDGGEIKVLLSDNNGLNWKELATVKSGGDQTIDLKPLVFRRYVYIARFVLKGNGTGLNSLKFTHDIQHSQRPLPALAQGANKIAFSAGPAEGTMTIEGAMEPSSKGKQLLFSDFHPKLDGYALDAFPRGEGEKGITFPVKTPGDITRLRISDFFLSSGSDSMYVIQVSFDDGKSWKTVDRPEGLTGQARNYVGRYVIVDDIPAATRSALVRYRGAGRNTLAMCNARIDADYQEPAGGFIPVRVTYLWEEGGLEKKDVHVARQPEETYTITCDSAPLMKSLIVELIPPVQPSGPRN